MATCLSELYNTLSMHFDIISEIQNIETIAVNTGIREVERLRKVYGKARWRKKKGIAMITLADGTTHQAELHWYEAAGRGRKEVKIKYLLD
jgi:hypothetical protein